MRNYMRVVDSLQSVGVVLFILFFMALAKAILGHYDPSLDLYGAILGFLVGIVISAHIIVMREEERGRPFTAFFGAVSWMLGFGAIGLAPLQWLVSGEMVVVAGTLYLVLLCEYSVRVLLRKSNPTLGKRSVPTLVI